MASHPPPLRGKSVTHVSGTFCYLCLRPHTLNEIARIRFEQAPDLVVGFESRVEAERFLKEFRERVAPFGLELHTGYRATTCLYNIITSFPMRLW